MATNYDQPMTCLYPSGEGVYDGIGRNICCEESFLPFAISPPSANVVCSVCPQDMWITTLPTINFTAKASGKNDKLFQLDTSAKSCH